MTDLRKATKYGHKYRWFCAMAESSGCASNDVQVFLPYPDHFHPMSLSAPSTLVRALSATSEVVLVSTTAAVAKHVTPPGAGVVCKPLLCTVTVSPL